MPPRSQFSTTPPYAVQDAIKTLGANLRTARVRRNISIADMASRLGVDRHVVADAERGKLTTNIGVYVGMMWVMDLLGHLSPVADPTLDEEGLARAMAEERDRAYPSGGMSNDF
jgi:transcriptional regulator with XRE-family HTH domain